MTSSRSISYSRNSPSAFQKIDRLAVLGPFAGIEPGFAADRKYSDATTTGAHGADEIGDVVDAGWRNQRQDARLDDVDAGVHQVLELRLLLDTGELPAGDQLADTVRDPKRLQRCHQR